jgi:hypothetical protein
MANLRAAPQSLADVKFAGLMKTAADPKGEERSAFGKLMTAIDSASPEAGASAAEPSAESGLADAMSKAQDGGAIRNNLLATAFSQLDQQGEGVESGGRSALTGAPLASEASISDRASQASSALTVIEAQASSGETSSENETAESADRLLAAVLDDVQSERQGSATLDGSTSANSAPTAERSSRSISGEGMRALLAEVMGAPKVPSVQPVAWSVRPSESPASSSSSRADSAAKRGGGPLRMSETAGSSGSPARRKEEGSSPDPLSELMAAAAATGSGAFALAPSQVVLRAASGKPDALQALPGPTSRSVHAAGPALAGKSDCLGDLLSDPVEAKASTPAYTVDAARTFLAPGSSAERLGRSADTVAATKVLEQSVTTQSAEPAKAPSPKPRLVSQQGSASSFHALPAKPSSVGNDGSDALQSGDKRAKPVEPSSASRPPAAGSSTEAGAAASSPATTGSSGLSPSIGVADVPRVVVALATEAGSPTSDSSSAPSTSTPSGPAPGDTVVKELDLSLDPEDLGKIRIKLRSEGSRISVMIEVQSRSALLQIDAQKDQIARSLTVDGQNASSVVVRETPALAQSATGQTAGSAGSSYTASGSANSSGEGNHGSHANSDRHSEQADRREFSSRSISDDDASARRSRDGIFV